MDGTTVDYVVIPIVAVICLATWLATVYWADGPDAARSRPAQRGAGRASGQHRTTQAAGPRAIS
jgi:hypothetical protein